MFLRIVAIIALLPCVAVVCGCRCPSGGCVPRTPCLPCVPVPAEAEVEPPNLASLSCENCELVPLPSPAETYLLLDAGTCQCSAATNAAAANMVELERHWAKVVIECDTQAVRENFCLDRDLLALHAVEIRNESAAAALNAFYQLAGLEAKKHFLRLAFDETGKTLERINNLREKGLDVPESLDYSAVETRLHQLKDQQFQLEFSRIQLNGQLQKLLGCPINEYAFYWPQVNWQVDLTPVDVQAELAHGMAMRTDLRGLELLLCKSDKTTLPVTRAVLAYADETVGSVEPRSGLLHVARCFRCNQSEVPIRCRQLAMFYTDTEHLATAELKGDAYKIILQQQRAANAQQAVEHLRARVEELTKTRDVKNVAIFDISKVRGDLYEAEVDLIDQVVALEMAKVELRRAQGELARECGFEPRLCCEGCCDGACCKQSRSKCKK